MVYQGPALLIRSLSPRRMFQDHDVGELGNAVFGSNTLSSIMRTRVPGRGMFDAEREKRIITATIARVRESKTKDLGRVHADESLEESAGWLDGNDPVGGQDL